MRRSQNYEKCTTHRACIVVVNWESEAGKERYYDTTFPRSAITMSTNDAMHDCTSNVILNLYIVYDSSMAACKTLSHVMSPMGHSRRNEELIFNVDEMFRPLNSWSQELFLNRDLERNRGHTFEVCCLNGLFSFSRSTERPRAGGAAYLHLAGAS
jgi:hypothetical protein